MEDDQTKIKNGRRPKKKNGGLPQQKMEDDLNKNWKMEDDLKNKMEEEPINQNQPNWLWNHCKFT